MTTATADLGDFHNFLPITKVDKKKKMVYGYASTPTLDSDSEIVALKAIKDALPDYLKWSNIREMHQAIAVGVAKEATMDEKGLWIGAHIVDKAAWEKVEAGVYKGFSIGGKVLAKTGNIITSLLLAEISIVDRPANPDCKIEVIKAQKLVEGGEAELSKSFDVPDEPELEIEHEDARGIFKLLGRLGNMLKGATVLSGPAGVVTTPSAAADLPEQTNKDLEAQDEARSQDQKAQVHAAPAVEMALIPEFGKDIAEKGMYEAGRLCYVFDDMRSVQRQLIREGMLEGDTVDTALAAQVGAAAQGVAALIATIASHEADEAASLTDENDVSFFNNMGDRFAMSATNTDIEKRVSAAIKGALAKAHGHIGEAHKAHGQAIAACNKMAEAINNCVKAAAAGDGVIKASDLVPHMNALHKAMSGMGDQHDLAAFNIGKAMSGANGTLSGTPNLEMVAHSTVSEGSVPGNDPTKPYPGKVAGAEMGKYAGMNEEQIGRMIDLEKTAAAAQAQAEVYSKMPVGSPRAKTFALPADFTAPNGVGNAGGGKTMSKGDMLLDGVVTDGLDQGTATQNAGKMIANMFRNPSVFAGNPLTDANFHGAAAG